MCSFPLQWDVRGVGVTDAVFVSLMNWILTSLSVGGTGGVVVTAIRRYAPRVRRSYWWLLMRHAILAQLFRLVPSMGRDALVHELKRALIEAVPPPVMQCRRVPAQIEVILPTNAVRELDGVGPGLSNDLISWLVQQAQYRVGRCPSPDLMGSLSASVPTRTALRTDPGSATVGSAGG
jgi:hypothetical protein